MKNNKLRAICLAGALLYSQGSRASAQNGTSPGSVDLPFTGYTNLTYPVWHMTPRPTGGYFVVQGPRLANTTPPTDQIIAVTASIERDVTFQAYSPPTAGLSGFVSGVFSTTNHVYVTGNFDLDGISGRSGLVRLQQTGAVDSGFLPNFDFYGANLIVSQPDGKIIMSVSSAVFNGFTKRGLTRFSPDGTLDSSFHFSGTGADPGLSLLHILADNKILVAGFTNLNGITKRGIAKLNSDGTTDLSYFLPFALNGNTNAGSIEHFTPSQAGGIVLAGNFTSIGGHNTTNLARLNQDGSVDTSFVAPAIQPAYPLSLMAKPLVLPDGKLVVAGAITNVGGFTRNGIARLNADGSVDTAFSPGSGVAGDSFGRTAAARAVSVQPDGKLLVGGTFHSFSAVQHDYLVRIHGDGTSTVTQSTNGGVLMLNAPTTGGGALFQWQLNGTNLIGATNSILSVTNVSAASAGRYSVVVSDGAGTQVSQPTRVDFFGDLKVIAAAVLAGPIGQPYRVDFADVVSVGTTNWLTLTNVTLPYSPFLVIDPNSAGRTQRYYRAVPLP
jgi:uncharacterized delta-60 repeat protein